MMSAEFCSPPLWMRIRRRCIGGGFAVLAVFLTVDAIPWGVLASDGPKRWVARTMQRVGLVTGPMVMFTPNPIADNSWLSASIGSQPPSVSQWDSPNWSSLGAAERFIRFRSINYFNRLTLATNRAGAVDFADYLSRNAMSDDNRQPRVVLSANGLKVIVPSEGGVPTGDSVIRMLYSETIVTLDATP